MSNELIKQEIREATGAGARALASLKAAQEKLNSAGNWGMLAIFGGGLFTSMVKHSRMNEAVECMEQAKIDLKRFQRELKDVSVSYDLHIEINSFLSFADFFFDGIVADYLVQSKINDAKEQVEDAIVHVESLLADLKRMKEPF